MEVLMPEKFDKSPQAKSRRGRVIKRLENQLLTGFKTVTDGDGIRTEPLTPADRVRISKEIETLKLRL